MNIVYLSNHTRASLRRSSASLRRVCECGVAVLALALAATNAALAQEAPEGKAQFVTSCGVCHSVEPGAAARQGPNLAGVYGRAAGTVEGFKYSDALKAGGWVWDEGTLEPWMENAKEAHPGTNMVYRQKDADKRRLILAYLKTLTKAP